MIQMNIRCITMPTIAIPRCTILMDLSNLCGLKAHKAASSCCYAAAVVRNSAESGPGSIPTICTQLTAVPVALDMNSANVSSAIASRPAGLFASLCGGCRTAGLLVVLTTCHHGLTGCVGGGYRRTVESILHIPVVQDETGNLLLQPVILLHQQLVHRTQLSVHDL